VNDHLFCEGCYRKKIQPIIGIKNKNLLSDREAFYLMNWIPFESDMLSETVYRMKSDKCFQAWNHYGKLAAEGLSENVAVEEIKYIIPIPGSKPSSLHSHVFAQILGCELRKPVLNILEKASFASEQKRKSRLQRLNKTIKLREQFTAAPQRLNLRDKHILLVDDILTTGSSFIQSVEVLGDIQKATLMTLFYRTANANTVLVS